MSGPYTPVGEGDTFCSAVTGVRASLEVSERFELTEEVVGSLLAHASSGGELGGPEALWAGVEQEVHVGHIDVIEALSVQPLEHAAHNLLPRYPQERADHRRTEVLLRGSKGT